MVEIALKRKYPDDGKDDGGTTSTSLSNDSNQ